MPHSHNRRQYRYSKTIRGKGGTDSFELTTDLSGADLVEGRLNVIDSKANVFVGNNNRHAVASIYTAVGPFIKLDVLEQSRSADEKGTVYLWKDEARVLGKWLVANTRPTLKQRLGALMKRHNDKTQP